MKIKIRKKYLLIWLLLVSLTLSISALAQTPEEKGLEIAVAADKRDTGFETQTADLVMTLHNRQGQESTRYIRTRTLEVEGDGDKALSSTQRY